MRSWKPKKSEGEPPFTGGGISPSKSKPTTSTSRSPAKNLTTSFAFGSSTPRELSHINRVSRESRLIDTSPAKGGGDGVDEHDILYYMRQARSKTLGGSTIQADGKSKSWAFGSSTPREFSHLSRMRASDRIYDAKPKVIGDAAATTSLGLTDSKSATFQRGRSSPNNHTIPRSSRSKSRTPGGNTSKTLVARPSSIDAVAGNAAATALSEDANSVQYQESFSANSQASSRRTPVRATVVVDTKKDASSEQQLQKQSNHNTSITVPTKPDSSPHQSQPTTSSAPPPPLPSMIVSNNNNNNDNQQTTAVQRNDEKEEPTDSKPNSVNNKSTDFGNQTTPNQKPSQHKSEPTKNNGGDAAQDKSIDDKPASKNVVQTLEDILHAGKQEPLCIANAGNYSTSKSSNNSVVVTQEEFSKVEIKPDGSPLKVSDERPPHSVAERQPTVNAEKLISSNYVLNQKADQTQS